MAVDLLETLSSEQPCLVKCADYGRSDSRSSKDVEIEFEELVKSSLDKPVEDRFNLVFLLCGKLQHNLRACLRLVNQCDLDAVKSKYTDGVQSLVYGIYKGGILPVYKLKCYNFPTLSNPRISVKSDTARRGNARRAAVQAASLTIKPEPSTSRADSNQAKASSRSSSKPSASVVSFFGKKLDGSKPQGKKSNAKKETVQPKQQNKLNFTSGVKTKLPSCTTDERLTVEEEKQEAIPDSKLEVTSDKVTESAKTTIKSRQRVRMMSGSSSDEEMEEKKKSKKKKSPKKKEKSTERKSNKPEPESKEATLLDADDIQFESDDEQMMNGSNDLEKSEDKPKKKRQKRKVESDGEETTSNNKKSKTPTFGKVKTGETSSSMKYVDKTWLDVDGFLVTEKVLEEDRTLKATPDTPKPNVLKETAQKQKVDSAPPATKKKSKPVPSHQSSITSFFKKK